MAFDSLSERLNKTMRDIAGKGKLTDKNMEDMLKEVRLALLEADVNYRVVKDFLNSVREKARGEDVLSSVEPGQMLVKIVHDEIVDFDGKIISAIGLQALHAVVADLIGIKIAAVAFSAFDAFARIIKKAFTVFDVHIQTS
jgi:signal recognition particle subunit SRP54